MTLGLAQAQPYYGGGGMDNSYDDDRKSYGKDDNRDKSKDSVNVKKIKCNNINVNVNGIELNVTSFPFLNGVADDDKDSSEGKYGDASYRSDGSYGNGGSYGDRNSDKDKDDFSFVCINNNNNVVVSAPNVTDGADEKGCEECFADLTVDLKVILNEALAEGFSIGPLEIPPGSTVEDLCDELEEVGPIEITARDIIGFIFENQIFNETDIFSLIQLLLCLQDLELIDFDLFDIFRTLQESGLISSETTTPEATAPTTP
jgi:hypothetical protein